MRPRWLLGLATAAAVAGAAVAAAPGAGQNVPSFTWQNPFLAPNNDANIHLDSYYTDTYLREGPTKGPFDVQLVQRTTFNDFATGAPRTESLGLCPAIEYDADGNAFMLCVGPPDLSTRTVPIKLFLFDQDLNVLAFAKVGDQPYENLRELVTQFNGAYFHVDNQGRPVVALANGHIGVFERQASTAGGVDSYVAVRDVNVVGTGGLVPIPRNLDSLSLYAVMPDKDGNLWWTTNDGVVGALKPDNTVTWIDYNDINGDGIRRSPRSPRYERLAASHSVDQGDSARGASGAYMVSTHRMRRMGLGATGNVQIVWSARYPRGIRAKPGQVNRGSGTSPTVFNMAGRRFVVISDNAERMGVVVFRTERRLRRGETRQFARVVPFGRSRKVANENSHIAYPDGPRGMWIYVENNYGYTGPAATLGRRVTEPGFARIALRADGTVRVASLNKTIRIPSVVSQASLPSKTIYTYNKTARGWFLTALDARNVNRVVFRTLVARTGLLQLIDPNETLLRAYGPDVNTRNLGVLFNNNYSALNVAPDTSVWIGTLFGFVRVAPRDA